MLSAALGAVFLFTAMPANAQAMCGPRARIIELLETRYQEKASAIGLAGNGGVVELYTSEKGSWTLLLTQPNGISCLIAAGGDWHDIPADGGKERTAL